MSLTSTGVHPPPPAPSNPLAGGVDADPAPSGRDRYYDSLQVWVRAQIPAAQAQLDAAKEHVSVVGLSTLTLTDDQAAGGKKALKDLTVDEVGALMTSIIELKPYSSLLVDKAVSGKALWYVDELSDLKDWGIPGAQAKIIFFELLPSWKESGVDPRLFVRLPVNQEALLSGQAAVDSAERRLAWLLDAVRPPRARGREALAFRPQWSFAGDLLQVAADIMDKVSTTIPPGTEGRGTKDDRQLVYVSNPPRHGKSLLLDQLFRDDPTVCVLSVTYNAATPIHPLELATPSGALCGLFLRILNDLVASPFHKNRWTDLWQHSPLEAIAGDADALLQVFENMLGLHSDDAPAKFLICIDEVSKLTDDPGNMWARAPPGGSIGEDQKVFWRGLYSLTRANTKWVRVTMTGFTDSPRIVVAASDVGCSSASLSMITDAEQQLLTAELLWAHARLNVRFPGLLWAVVKSTPGLLGLWAQQIHLGPLLTTKPNVPWDSKYHVCTPRSAMNPATLGGGPTLVPWIGVLQTNASRNWPLMLQFMLEDNVIEANPVNAEIQRAVRNAEVATALGSRLTLSPFAVAITVFSLRGQRPEGGAIFEFLDMALRVCEGHSAGCASGMPVPWPRLAQNHIKKWLLHNQADVPPNSLLALQPDLTPSSAAMALPPARPQGPGVDFAIGSDGQEVGVHKIGEAFEEFVMYALALRLECARQKAARAALPGFPLPRTPSPAGSNRGVPASQFLPPGVGYIQRPPSHVGCLPRHASEGQIVVSVMNDPAVDLARMCTQTAALLLPSTVSRIMQRVHTDNSVSRSKHLLPFTAAGSVTPEPQCACSACNVAAAVVSVPAAAVVSVTAADDAPAPLPDGEIEPPHDPIATARFDYSEVIVIDRHSPAPPPSTFPAVVLTPNTNLVLMQQLVDSLRHDAATGTDNSAAFCSRIPAPANAATNAQVFRNVEDVRRVKQLALSAANERHAILFKPTDGVNPLCDDCAIIPLLSSPSGRRSVCFLFIEVKDREKNHFGDKLDLLTGAIKNGVFTPARELLLAPVVIALEREGVDVGLIAFVQCGRTQVVVQP